MIQEKIFKILQLYRDDAHKLAVKITDPKLLGPSITTKLIKIFENLLLLSLILSLSTCFILLINIKIAILSAILALLILILPKFIILLWMRLLGWGVDREIPALLAYLLPYASGPKYLTDIMINIPKKYFQWFKWEASRLGFLCKRGMDPIIALRELAKTTSSKKLREALLDYVHAYELGTPRSQVTLRLLERAISEVREQWRSYIELSKGVVEAIVAIILSLVVLTPIGYLAGSNIELFAFILVLLSPLSVLLMISLRPIIGESSTSSLIPLISVVGAISTSLIYLRSGFFPALILLFIFTIIIEILVVRDTRKEAEAFNALRELAVGAKYGRFIDIELARALPVASKLLGAFMDALKYAGKLGAAEALSNVYRVTEEARHARLSAKGQGLILTFLTVITPPVAIYMVKTISAILQGNQFIGGPGNQLAIANYIVSLSPIIPLIATALWRGKRISLIPSLLSMILSGIVLIFL